MAFGNFLSSHECSKCLAFPKDLSVFKLASDASQASDRWTALVTVVANGYSSCHTKWMVRITRDTYPVNGNVDGTCFKEGGKMKMSYANQRT